MTVHYHKQDIIEAFKEEISNPLIYPILAHGVNCKGVFNAGLAKQIAKHFPYAKEAYIDKYNKEGWKLNEIQYLHFVDPGDCRYGIVNCATQLSYGRKTSHASYTSIIYCLRQVRDIPINLNKKIMIPKIGCGLGGLQWSVVKAIIENEFDGHEVHVYSLEGF